MIRAGVFGSGEVLENALEVLRGHNGFLITGYHSGASIISKHAVIKQYTLPDELISVSEALIITNNPGDFLEVIPSILKKSRHLLIFPDHSLSFYHLEDLIKLADEAGVVFYLHQDGIKDWMKDLVHTHCGKPEFIEIHSYINKQQIKPGSGIFETLYKAICTVMKLNPVNPRKFYTSLVPYYSPNPLMTNVRLDFENGTSANVTINGFLGRDECRIEIYRNDCHVIIDMNVPELRIIKKNPNSTRVFNKPAENPDSNLSDGLDSFALRLFSTGVSSDPFDSGIIAHKTATKIIHQYIPYHQKSS
ncbi:MAG: hypothetical protein H6538_01880 [Bacteroidales bacterium]|nr:hypothetical protein [Bacteroidales bacterium]MCB9013148.1 hypothetical protein [Bacteroidales bacterium]